MKYILIEHADGNDPKVVRIFDTPEDRELATREAILGLEGRDNEDIQCPELLTLEEYGLVHFEGDPPVQWLDAEVIQDDTILREAHSLLNNKQISWKFGPGPWRDRRDEWNKAVEKVKQ